MKQYIKDNKIYNTPVQIEQGGKITFTNDDTLLKKQGFNEYVFEPVKKTKEQLIEQSNESINKLTDEKILNGFVFKDAEFYLTMQNQTNFANMFIAKDYLTYPQQVKTKDGFIKLNNIEEVSEFYLAGVNYIKECIEQGWKQKAAAELKIKREY